MGADSHCFNVELATRIGLAESIVLQHFFWWWQHNKNTPEMFRDGRVWFFRSVAEMREVFPYLSDANVRTAIKHLCDAGLAVKGDFPNASMNRSTWYSLTDLGIRQFHLAESANPFVDSTNALFDSGKSLDTTNTVNRKDTRTDTISNAPAKFVPPSVEDVRAYCLERSNRIDPQQFVDFYTANGWMVGKSKMKDWRAAVRTWEGRRKENPTPQAPRPRFESPEMRTLRALRNLQERDGMLHTFRESPDEQ